MDMRTCVATRLLLTGFLCAAVGQAQFPQYTAPGSLAVPQTPTRERVETSAEEARWDLGALRLDPRFWMRDLGYSDNVFGDADDAEQISDVTATVGAGLVAYSNLGSNVIVSAYLLPEYTWWQDLEQLREEHLNYGAGIFGFYNRLTLIIDARRDERQRFLNAETLVPFDIRSHRVSLRVAIDLRGPIELFGSVEAEDFEHRGSASPLAVEQLDRKEAIGRLGVAYRFPSEARIGLGVEASETELAIDPGGRSNTTFGPLVEIGYETDDVSLAATAVLRDIEFDGAAGSSSSELTGSLRAGWQAGPRIRLDAYGGRSLVYSVETVDRFFTEDRIGLSVGTPWGRRFQLRVFGETGVNDYERVSDPAETREDDVTSYGGELDFELRRRLVLTAGATRTEFDSSLPELDRSVTVVRVGLRIGGDPQPW